MGCFGLSKIFVKDREIICIRLRCTANEFRRVGDCGVGRKGGDCYDKEGAIETYYEEK